MKKLMENWRSYEKEVLSERRAKKPADRILAEMVPDQTIPYMPPGTMRQPTDTETAIFDATSKFFDKAITGLEVADQAYWKNAMEPFADEVYAIDAASRAMSDSVGIPEAEASTLLRYGIPDSEWLLGLTEEELAAEGLTKDDAKQLAYLEWSDVIWDKHDPIDVAELVMAATGIGLAGAGYVWVANRIKKFAGIPGHISDIFKAKRLLKAMPALAEARKLDKIYDSAGNVTDATRKFSIVAHKKKTLDNGKVIVTHIPEIKIKGLDTSIKPMHGGELRSVPAPIGPNETQISIPFLPEKFSEFDADGNPIAKYLYFDKTDFNQMVEQLPELQDLANLSSPKFFERSGAAAANFLGDFNAMTIPKAAGRAAMTPLRIAADHPKTSLGLGAAAATGVVVAKGKSDKAKADSANVLNQLGLNSEEPLPQDIADLIDKSSSGEPGTGVDYWEDPEKPPGRRSVRYQESIKRKKEIIKEEIIKYFSNRR